MTINNVTRIVQERKRPPIPKDGQFPPQHIYPVPDYPFKGWQPPQPEGYKQSAGTPTDSAIVIDTGASTLKIGWSFDKKPRYLVPPLLAKYKDRKWNKYCAFVGYDCYADATTRGQIRNAFENFTSVPVNWDVMEGILDYTFLKLGVTGQGGIERPVVMTETIANLAYTRKTMNEMLFECYSAPSVTYGLDSLFSYRQNKGSSGLIVSSGHTATHVIPVIDRKPYLHNCARLNWGGAQAAEYLHKLLRLKYPVFQRMTTEQMESYLKQFCYLSTDFDREMSDYLEWEGLDSDRNIVIQYPFTEQVVVEKSAEELARIEERKREQGRRLQEQAAKMRLDKLIKKEQELEYYRSLHEQYTAAPTKKEQRRILDERELKDEAALERVIRDLDKSIKKSRNKDLGGNPEEEESLEEQLNKFPLLEVPDDQLDEDGIKEKRHQRLMKSGVEARIRAKAEKEAERARQEEEKRLDEEHRMNDPDDWVEGRRAQRNALLVKIKENQRLKADSGNRKGMASQMRMKTLANLASDGPKRKRRGPGEYDDDFGANDEDWGVYRTVQTEQASDDEEPEEDPEKQLRTIEDELLQYDSAFTAEDTLDAQTDWTRSLYHAFLHGGRPWDPESPRENAQIHLNVERIRVPEVIFQPSIAGVDQAGIVEIIEGVVMNRFTDALQQKALLQDIFLTGGNVLFKNFEDRLREELVSALPAEYAMKVRTASDPVLDAWKGAASWWAGASASDRAAATVSRAEYAEKGSDYLKEHDLGNAVAPALV